MSSPSVFISYSHTDAQREWVERFALELESRGVDAWFDQSSIKVGDSLLDAIESALRSSDAIVAIISREAARNPNVYFELGVALGANKRLILIVDPDVVEEDVPLELRLPKYLIAGDPVETAHEVAHAVSLGVEESASTEDALVAMASSLTERELEVLRLMANGVSNKQIADALEIEPSTVDRHVHNILEKLEIPGGADAVVIPRDAIARLRERGLLRG